MSRITQPLFIVTLGHQKVLVPQAQALKLMEIASKALVVDYDFEGNSIRYRVGEPLEVEATTVKSDQLIMPTATAAPAAPKRPRPLKLTGH